MGTTTEDQTRKINIKVWTDTARGGVITSVTEAALPRDRSGISAWLIRGELLSTILPLVLTAVIIGAELFLVGVIGPKFFSDLFLSIVSIKYVGATLILPIIIFVGFATMGGRRFDGGMLGGIAGIMVRGVIMLVRALVPVRFIYRSVQRLMNDYIITPLRQNGRREVPNHIIRLQREMDDAEPQDRRAALSAMLSGRPVANEPEAQVVFVHLHGDLKGAAVYQGQKAVFHGQILRNGIFLADYGIDYQSGAEIKGSKPRGFDGR